MPLSLSRSLSSHLFQSQLSQLRYLAQPHSLNVVLRPLGHSCASVCAGIGVEIGVWFQRLGSWIWVWWISAFGLLDFRGHGGDGGGGGSFCWWWVVSAWVRFVICGCGFVLWCVVGLFCGAVLVMVVLCFMVLWVFIFIFIFIFSYCGCS